MRRGEARFLLFAVLTLLGVTSGCFRNAPVDESVRMNDTSLQVTPRTSSMRIVTLGDSLAYGAGDESDGGIAGRLDDLLVERGLQSVQATNLGVNGAQTSDVMRKLRSERVRAALAEADAIVLSVGANDLFRTPDARNRVMRDPLGIAADILRRITAIVDGIHEINPEAHVLVLGGYNPVPDHPMATMIDQYLGLWDAGLAREFEDDPLVRVVSMADIVSRSRLSRHDSFHPGGEAYQHATERIAAILLEEIPAGIT